MTVPVQRIKEYFQKDYSAGMITNVNENIIPRNSVKLGMNVDFDEELGSPVSRLGTGIVDAQLVDAETVLGVHDFRDSDGSNHALLATINASGGATSVVYKVGTGTIVTGLTADLKMRFLTFLDSALMVNGTDAPRSYDGSTVITTGGAFDLANVPFAEPSLCIEFLDRVYLAGDSANPDRLYHSSLPSSGAISWTSGNGTVDIEPEDGGGGITAFGKVPGFLLIFKERSMKRWDFQSAFPESLVNTGTISQESVISAAGLCAFFSSSSRDSQGFYITNGGRPVPISHLRSKNIAKWVKAIPQSFHANVNGWGTENHFFWSIGDVTVDGVDYTNVVIRWSVKTGEWAVRSYPSEFRAWSSWVDSSGNNTVVAGDDNGNVIEIDKPDTFVDFVEGGTKAIGYEIETYEEDWDFNQEKEIMERVIFNTRNGRGATVYARENGGDRKILGYLDKDVTEVKTSKNLKGNFFTFGMMGEVDGAQMILKEIEVPEVKVLNTY